MYPELYSDHHNFMKEFPYYGRPKIIGYIGLENLKFARRVQEARVNYDLNLRLDEAIHRPEDLDVKITELLKFLLENERRLHFTLAEDMRKAKIFCYRGLLTTVACTPYEHREPWKIVAFLFKGDIYLCARDTEEKINRKMNMSEQEKRFCSWGYKFEQFILSDDPDSEPNPDRPVDEMEEFSLVFTTNLNSHTLVFGAEMDGIRCDIGTVSKPPVDVEPKDVINYLTTKKFIELKTKRHNENMKQHVNFRRYKSRKWWCQSFLVGIDTILCGNRSDDGIVEELTIYGVRELSREAKQFWNPNVCFNFLDEFLRFVKDCLTRKIKNKYGERPLHKVPLQSLLFIKDVGQPIRVSENYSNEDDPILFPWFLENYGKHGMDSAL